MFLELSLTNSDRFCLSIEPSIAALVIKDTNSAEFAAVCTSVVPIFESESDAAAVRPAGQ